MNENLRITSLVSLIFIDVLYRVALVEGEILEVGGEAECSPASREAAGARN